MQTTSPRQNLLERAKAKVRELGGIVNADGVCISGGMFAGIRDLGGEITITIQRPTWRKGYVSRSFLVLTENT